MSRGIGYKALQRDRLDGAALRDVHIAAATSHEIRPIGSKLLRKTDPHMIERTCGMPCESPRREGRTSGKGLKHDS
jgi:hypothetical protein